MPRFYNNTERATDRLVRSMRRDRLKRERETMSADEIDRRITAAILKSMDETGAVDRTYIVATNVPQDQIQRRFKACMAVAEEREPRLRHMTREWA